MASVLSSELGNTDKIYALTQECSRMGIKVLKPNILYSRRGFVVNKNNEIEYGLGAIKGVADMFIKHICETRNKFKFRDLWDFSKKVDIKLGGKKSLEALSQSGAFDSLSPSRSIAIACVEDMLKDASIQNGQSNLKSGDLFANFDESFDPYDKYKNIQELTLSEKLEFEKKSLGYYLSGHPVIAIDNKIKKIRTNRISDLNTDIKKEPNSQEDEIFFGCGCFWGAEKCFWKLPGVITTSVGYAGGFTKNPSYNEVCSGNTGHAEVVRVVWNKNEIDISDLLKLFWECHNPTQKNRQG